MNQILFLDIEINRKGKIVDFGALFKNQELHEKHTAKLEKWIEEAKYICGHNIIAHDIPELIKILGSDIFNGKKIIDTLLWSPLLFAQNPYHKLVKGYKIVNDSDSNNPLSDCKLTKELLIDELNAFDNLPAVEKRIYAELLNQSQDFKVFFELTKYNPDFGANLEMEKILSGTICSNVPISIYIKEYPVEFSYVFSLLYLGNNDSILPYWVKTSYPMAEQIIENIRFSPCSDLSCKYCSTKLNPVKALDEYFGYPAFRKFDKNRSISLQEETVRAGLQNHSFVTVFPTGGGKSLTFQLPALMLGESTRKLTVIISPLVSLMKDQVDNLKDRFGITKAVAINGLLSPLERQEAIDMVSDGRANLLYVSPESLRSPTIFKLILSRSIARIVIDEAHCFSTWGQDFRVDYLYIAEFIKLIQKEKSSLPIPVSCFTATAKPQVINDIKKYFKDKLDLNLKEFVTNAPRTNLTFEVVEVDDSSQKLTYLLPILKHCEKPAIVYVSRTRTVENVCGRIQEAGFNATFFHGQLDKEVKKANMDSFMHDEKNIIVATSAFGMGVDKDDVKTVIHYDISNSLENYIQEAGRAGRNENIQAKCYILYNESDLNKHFNLLQQTKLNQKEIKNIWRVIKNQPKNNGKISQSALQIAKKSGWDTEMRDLETKVFSAISTLEDQGFLVRKQNSPQVFADSLMIRNFSAGQEKILSSTQLSEEDKKDCSIVLKRIITDKEARIDYLADRTELSIYRIQDTIRILRDLGVLGDAKDLTAFVNFKRSHLGSRQVLNRFIKVESALINLLKENQIKAPLRQLNQRLIDQGIIESTVDCIRELLTYWDKSKFVKKKRIDKERDIYEINILSKNGLKTDMHWRHELAASVMSFLEVLNQQNEDGYKNDEVPISFSLLNMRDSNQFMGQLVESNTKKYETTLLFLNDIKAIKLEGGFMVSYNRLNIDNIDTKRHQFTNKDYEKMESHYHRKTEQIHIVGEYAKKSIENFELALSFVNDYFTLNYDEFLAQYFPKRKKEICQPLTPKRFSEIMENLDTEQTKVLSDNKSENTLVLAGPGSGKTKVLVHKIASLLLLEDIKPEQFMMLTFSKAAVLEFKNRVRELVPEFAGLIKITTFHGFCFQIFGQLGDLEKSQNVIKGCIDAIKNKEVDTSSIANKSVLLFDEFQDINKDEWELIKLVIEIADSPRVIAVGDDDQNIYGFRGSSNEHMKRYRHDYKATIYTLPKNYRSGSGIVGFNNKILEKLEGRMKLQHLIPAKNTTKTKIELVKYNGKYLAKPLVQYLDKIKPIGSVAVLTTTNYEALLINSLLIELGYKTRLLAGFDGFSLSVLDEIRWFGQLIIESSGDSGIILENDWSSSVDKFKSHFKYDIHFETCCEVLAKFHQAYPDKKLLIDWWEFCREIKMEDAIHSDSTSIIVSTIHKAKGKEFDHVLMLVENYDFRSDESKRLLYVASTRAKESLHIHTNINFYDQIELEELSKSYYYGELHEPEYYEIILTHKDVQLRSQKNSRASNIIKTLKTGDVLEKSMMFFGENKAPGLSKPGNGNMLLFSQNFIRKKLVPFKEKGYELASAKVEYLVYWYDKDDDKEYKVVLPRLRFEKKHD